MSSVANANQWELRKATDQDLAQFCAAVREKKNWQTKVLDEKIALKWAIEAELTAPDSQVLEGDALEAVSDLRRSVLLIRNSDREISLNARTDSSLQHFDETGPEADMAKTLKYARGSKYGLCEPELKEKGLGVFVSDDLVPSALHQELIRQLDALAAKEPRDFHPGSFGKVQDLIHPSLYPYIAGTTRTSSSDIKLPLVGTDGKFHTKISNLYAQEMTSSFAWIPSVFKVSPDGTDVHIDSYINGLGAREEYPGLFRVIEKMFLLALPHFEKTMKASADYNPEHTPSVRRWMERQEFASYNEGTLTREMWAQFIDEHSSKWDAEKLKEKNEKEKLRQEIQQEDSIQESFYKLGNEFVASDMYKGQELKVIVKAANYTLTPGREYEGSWHMEGMPHERIVASVIYYYDTDDSIEDQGLSFRKFRDSTGDFPAIEDSEFRHEDFQLSYSKGGQDDGDEDEDMDENEDCEDHYPSDWETELDFEGNVRSVSTSSLPFFIELGTVPTTNISSGANGTGRILSFPNWLQHKVGRVRNSSTSGNRVANRKILCFFLVDDTVQNETYISRHGFSIEGLENMNVLTTSEVPMQMRKCNEPTMRALISAISASLVGGIPLPRELIDIIWKYVSEGTLTREDAEIYRLKLMGDRKVSTFNTRNDYSLCEH